jgi:Fanconi anemia group M protein
MVSEGGKTGGGTSRQATLFGPAKEPAGPEQEQSGGKKVVIAVDHREAASNTAAWLRKLGADVDAKQLPVADYICSDRVCVERKTISDFLQSVTDQRLFRQLENMTSSFERPVLLLEGSPEMLFSERAIHPNTIRGVLSSIAVDYKIPILWTSNTKETAEQVFWMASREQIIERRPLAVRCEKHMDTVQEAQEFLVAGLPQVNGVLSRRLLKEFGNVRRIFSARPEQLMKVDGIGTDKAKKIHEVLNAQYEGWEGENDDSGA